VDASSLYQLLENQIVPLYYAKPDGKLPLAWLQLMRESIRSVTPVFNTQRMVKEYTERLYIPAAKSHETFSRDSCGPAAELSKWKTQIRKDWPQVRISDVQVGNIDRQNILVGESLQIRARIHLGAVDPKHVRVDTTAVGNGDIRNPTATVLNQTARRMRTAITFIKAQSPLRKRHLRIQRARRAYSPTFDASARTAPDHVVVASPRDLARRSAFKQSTTTAIAKLH
jgi:starch phosphorylase